MNIGVKMKMKTKLDTDVQMKMNDRTLAIAIGHRVTGGRMGTMMIYLQDWVHDC